MVNGYTVFPAVFVSWLAGCCCIFSALDPHPAASPAVSAKAATSGNNLFIDDFSPFFEYLTNNKAPNRQVRGRKGRKRQSPPHPFPRRLWEYDLAGLLA
jgi:hypothetical protein